MGTEDANDQEGKRLNGIQTNNMRADVDLCFN